MSATAVLPDVGQRATRRIARRLLPFLFVLYVVAFLDRVNVGYAGLEMSRCPIHPERDVSVILQ